MLRDEILALYIYNTVCLMEPAYLYVCIIDTVAIWPTNMKILYIEYL